MTTKELTDTIVSDLIAEIPIEFDGDEQGIREEMSAIVHSHVESYQKKMVDKACEWIKHNWRNYIFGPDRDGCIGFGLWENDFRNYMLNENKE